MPDLVYNEKFNDLWVEKYRPQRLKDVILPDYLMEKFQEYVDKGNIPNIMFVSSTPGTGKGSMLNALIHELDSDVKWINASQDNSVSTIRNEIVSFASTMSAQGKRKLLVLDEADNLTTSSQGSAGAQDILRGVIEQYAGNVRFFLTGNYKDRFIEPLLSRFIVFDFDIIFQEHKNEIAKKMYKRLMDICEIEGVEYDKKDIGEIVKKHYPSMRNMTISLQDNVINGKLKLQNLDVDDIFTDLMEKVKEKNYSATRGMVMLLNNPSNFYTWFWKKMDEFLPAQKQPGIVGELARYQEMDKIAKNKEITLMAFLLKLMSVYWG